MTLDLPTSQFSGLAPLTPTLAFSAAESDTNLATRGFTGTIHWGDGDTTAFSGSVSAAFSYTHVYSLAGVYYGTLEVSNKAYPDPQVVSLPFTVVVLQLVTSLVPPPVITGPSIPLDSSSNQNPWELDFSQDEALLASNLKVLLLTKRGERLMNPIFGTNLHRLIFDPIRGSDAAIKEEILNAVSLFEPRIKINSISVTFPESTAAQVIILFSSRISSRVLGILLPFSRA